MGQRYMELLSEFLAEDRAVDAEWRERAHGMEALVAFAAWLDAAQQVAETDRAGQSGARHSIDMALRELGSIRVFGNPAQSQQFIQNAIAILAEAYRALGPAA